MLTLSDNLQFLSGLEAESVDLIYLDPPFYSQRDYIDFEDKWESIDDYLKFLGARVFECHRVLKPTGSIYLHCDDSANADIKIHVLNTIFGRSNFRNEIVWHYSGGSSSRVYFPKKHDTIYFYTKTNEYIFNPQHQPYSDQSIARFNRKDHEGRMYKAHIKDGKEIRSYMNEEGRVMPDVWNINIIVKSHNESMDYSTQKPLALIERIIRASSNEGDVVLDPFLGAGTTAVACKKLGRKFIGCDINPRSIEITNERLSMTLSGLLPELN